MRRKSRSSPARFLIGALIVFFLAAFILPVLLFEQDPRLYVLGGVAAGAVLIGGTRLMNRLASQDRILFVLSVALCALSILVTALSDPGAGVTQAFRCAGALIFMVLGSLLIRVVRPSVVFAMFPAVPAVTLLVLPLLMEDPGFRPAFAAVTLLMVSFVVLLTARKQLFAMLLGLAGTLLLLAQKDAESAAVWSLTFLLLFWAYSGHPAVLLAGAGFVALSGYGAGLLFPGLFSPADTESVFSAVNPGLFGLDWSDPLQAAAAAPDASLFTGIAVRYGWILAACVLMFYPVIIMRGSALARASRSRLHGMLAMGAVLLTGLTAVAALFSDFGFRFSPVLPLPGLTCDPVSLCSFLFLTGLAGGVSVRSQADLDEEEHIGMLAG